MLQILQTRQGNIHYVQLWLWARWGTKSHDLPLADAQTQRSHPLKRSIYTTKSCFQPNPTQHTCWQQTWLTVGKNKTFLKYKSQSSDGTRKPLCHTSPIQLHCLYRTYVKCVRLSPGDKISKRSYGSASCGIVSYNVASHLHQHSSHTVPLSRLSQLTAVKRSISMHPDMKRSSFKWITCVPDNNIEVTCC